MKPTMIFRAFILIAGTMLVTGCYETSKPKVKKTEPKNIPTVEEETEDFTLQTGLAITVDGRDDPEFDPSSDGYLFEGVPSRSLLETSSKKARRLEDGRPGENDNFNAQKKAVKKRHEEKQARSTIAPRTGKTVKRMAFPVYEYNQLDVKGESTLSGKANIKKVGGGSIIAKNAKLYLNPVTSYSEQWYNESIIKGNKVTEADKRIYEYLKYTTTDGSGNYGFYGLAAGEYYITGKIRCGKACGLKNEAEFVAIGKVRVPESGKASKNLSLAR